MLRMLRMVVVVVVVERMEGGVWSSFIRMSWTFICFVRCALALAAAAVVVAVCPVGYSRTGS